VQEHLLETTPGEYPAVSSFLREPPETVAGVDVFGAIDPGTHNICLGLVSISEVYPPLACVEVVV
jgi:hypothetical protein